MRSCAEYGKVKSPQKENFNCKPISSYARAKNNSTNFMKKLSIKKNFPGTVLRFYQVYGPKQDANRLIPIVINNCIKNKKFPCLDGKQFRDFLYIDDAIEAIIKSLKNKKSTGEILNIGQGKPMMVKNLIEYIKKKIKKGKPVYGKIKLRKDEAAITFPNIKKAKKIINWKPKTSFQNGLKKTINFYNE